MPLNWHLLIFLMQRVCYISFLVWKGNNKTRLWRENINTCLMLLVLCTFNLEFLFNFGVNASSLLPLSSIGHLLHYLIIELPMKFFKNMMLITHLSEFLAVWLLLQLLLLIEPSFNLDLRFVFYLVILLE